MKKFYVTTPIYYVNARPHIGHAYTTVLGDVLTRYHKMMGENTWFLTGTDEHGEKVQIAANDLGLTPIQHCDNIAADYQKTWKNLNIANDDFIRTTQERHIRIVKKVLQDLFDRGLIYKGTYEGHYCVPCEQYCSEQELDSDGLCPSCGRPTETRSETCYYFKLKDSREWLIEYIKTHPDFIKPAYRANETLKHLEKEMNDLCISRPKSRFDWGIELPFDPDYVCYVWFDALLNYVTAMGFGSDDERFREWWQESHHLIGKDILFTHTVYWPIMLKAMGIQPPKTIQTHGWWVVKKDAHSDVAPDNADVCPEVEKMSKSKGNVITPETMISTIGVDAFRYFLMAEMNVGSDMVISIDSYINRYNTNLSNDLGNLLNRAVKLTAANFDSKIPKPGKLENIDAVLLEKAKNAVCALENHIRDIQPSRGIHDILTVIRATNKYMEETKPWELAKKGDRERLATVLYVSIEVLRIAGGALTPIMPAKMAVLRESVGASTEVSFEELKNYGISNPGTPVKDLGILFPKHLQEKEISIQSSAEKPKKQEKSVKEKKPAPVIPEGCISIEDFFKTELRTAKVIAAEPVPNTEKLLKLQVQVGEEQRQIVAGIALFYKPEDLIGKLVVIVANLAPAKLRGIESNGMLLAASAGDSLKLVTVDTPDFPSGIKIG